MSSRPAEIMGAAFELARPMCPELREPEFSTLVSSIAEIIARHMTPLIARERVDAIRRVVSSCKHCGGAGFDWVHDRVAGQAIRSPCRRCDWITAIADTKEDKAKGMPDG